jgi:long-subunit fatty acid transport protein
MRTRSVLRSLIILIAGMILIPVACHAAGTTGGIFLNVGVNAKAEAMGGAYTAIADNSSSVNINPAGMTQIPNSQVSVMHNEYLLDITQDYFSYVTKVGTHAFGGSLIYLDAGSQSGYTASNEFTGTFRPTNYALTFAYGADAGKVVSYGVAIKYIKEKIQSFSGTTFAVDGGVLYKPDKNWRYAAALSNLGSGLKLDQTSDPLPLTLKLGTAYVWDKLPLTTAFDIYLIKRESPEYHLGLQYMLQKIVAVRMGYNSAYDAGSGLTFGIGLNQPNYAVDYAYIPSKDLGDSHRFSLSLNF